MHGDTKNNVARNVNKSFILFPFLINYQSSQLPIHLT